MSFPDLPGLPPTILPTARKLFREPLSTADALRSELKGYRHAVHRAHDGDENVDLDLAMKLIGCAEALLDLQNSSTPKQTQRVIQVAVRYLIMEEDAVSDMTSVVGFDDDAAVLNAVVRWLGHDELVVPIP